MLTTDRKLRVFLCHASQDKPIVSELYQRLLAEDWIDPWLDEEKLLLGQNWDIEIEKAVEAAHTVIVCLSKNSVNKEGYVQAELSFVLDMARTKPEEEIFIIPLRLDDCLVPRRLRIWHHADYFPKEQRELVYGQLCKSLREKAKVLGMFPSEQPGHLPREIKKELIQEITTDRWFQHGNLRLDFARAEVWRGDRPVYLSATEYRLLLQFIHNIGKVLTAEELLTSVWGPEYREEKEILWVCIARMRQKLEDDPHSPKHIVTRSGYGYIMP